MNQLKSISSFLAAIALVATAGCAATASHESTGQYVDDATITTKVKAAIFEDKTLRSDEINVETYKGRVQLSGFVRSKANMDQAVVVAQGVGGVQIVKNDMHLK